MSLALPQYWTFDRQVLEIGGKDQGVIPWLATENVGQLFTVYTRKSKFPIENRPR